MTQARKITGFRTAPGNWNGSHKAWSEIFYIKDNEHFHMELVQDDDGSACRSYMTADQIAAHLAKFNGHYVYKRDGANYTVTRDSQLVESNTYGPRGGYSQGVYEACTCAALAHAFGDDFTGYEHNYVFADNHARAAD